MKTTPLNKNPHDQKPSNRDECGNSESFGEDQTNGVGTMGWSPSLGEAQNHRSIMVSHWTDQGRFHRERQTPYVSSYKRIH
ncbi:MAG: hypothetical protein J0L93_05365 [Deltaproteobacteria bacterium]|nr:hypothetical protein [Deltaproteobacteria bacterium]